MIVIDVGYIFEICGGAQGLVALLKKHHTTAPTLNTVHMWKHRNHISGEWITPIIYTLTREGHELSSLMTETEFA